MTRPRLPGALLHLLFFLSGSAALGYQMVWTKMFAPGLGHEMPAVLAVVAAFMGGMALGAWMLDRTICRSPTPGRWYGWLELLVGGWGFVSATLIPIINQAALSLIGLDPSPWRHWTIAFLLPLLTLLPATAGLGATFPAMERFLSPLAGRCVGGLYAANTFGALIGTLLSVFALMPALGFRGTTFLLAAVNVLCGIAALALEPCVRARSSTSPQLAPVPQPAGRLPVSSRQDEDQTPPGTSWRGLSRLRLAATALGTGLLGIGYEVVGVRVLAQVLENTVYTFASVLSVYLLGTAAGGALYQRWGRRTDACSLLFGLLSGISLASLLGVLSLSKAQWLYNAARSALGDRPAAVLAAEWLVAASVFALPTLLMGATFSHVVQCSRRAEAGVGRAAALNTLGGAGAGALFGVSLLPLIGSKWALVLVALGYLLLVPVHFGWSSSRRAEPSRLSPWHWAVLAVLLLAGCWLVPPLRMVQVPPGGRLLDYREGVMASVAVVEDATGNRTLRVNNRFQMGGTGATNAEYLQAHLPLLLHPAPRRALFLGAGTGITLGAAGLYPGLRSDGVELVPEVVEVMPQFEPFNFAPTRHPQLKVHIADARRFVRAGGEGYDVIVADLFHPARDGAGSLYTREHFQAIRQRLAPDGVFCQWLPLHQLDEPMLRLILRTFLDVFPDATAWLLRFNVDVPVMGLTGRLSAPHFSDRWLKERALGEGLEAQLRKLALSDSIRLFGHWLAGPRALRDFAGPGPLNTDDAPRVTFGAPRFSYLKDVASYDLLLTLLERAGRVPGRELPLDPAGGLEPFRRRLLAYLSARDVYLQGLVEEAAGRTEKAIDAFVESARRSEDFTPGYAQCLTFASLQAKANPAQARRLLERLVEAQPSRPIAQEMLQRLFGEGGKK